MSIRIMSLVWATPCHNATEKLVLLALADNANDDAQCWPSLRMLISKCDLSRQGVVNVLRNLEAKKWISISKPHPKRASNTYTLNLPGVVNGVDWGGSQRRRLGESTTLTTVVNGVDPNHHITITDPSVPPIVPQGGHPKRKTVHEVSDEVKAVASRFWESNPSKKPIGEPRIRKELRDLELLLASGVSEAQIFRASEMLSTDEFRQSWVSSLGKMVEKWPQIASRLNGHLKPVPELENKWEHAQLTAA